MRLIINPEIDYVWLDKSSLQVTFQNGHSIQINELPLETQKIFTRLDGITSISQIFIEFGIDERIHSEIQESFSFLIKNRILINQNIMHQKFENLKNSYIQVLGLNTLAYQISHLLAAAGVGRIVLEDLSGSQNLISLGDINCFGPKAKEIGTSLSKSIKQSISYFDAKIDRPNNQVNPDLVVICKDLKEYELNEILHKKIVHVFVNKIGDNINVGPFVIPENQTCTRCQSVFNLKNKIRSLIAVKSNFRELDKNPTLTTLASSLVATNVVSFLSKELIDQNPSLLNMVCELNPVGPEITFKNLMKKNVCTCKWDAA